MKNITGKCSANKHVKLEEFDAGSEEGENTVMEFLNDFRHGILSKLSRKFKTFVTIGNSKRLRFLQAFFLQRFYRAFILFIPFNKLKKKMGNHKSESAKEVDITSHRIAREVRWAILQAARHTPWESECIVQALTAAKMMKNQAIETTIYLGVKKDLNDEMLAHAWVRCGSFYITGGENRREYAVVGKFSTK